MLATIISKLGLPLLINVIGGALSRVDNPVAQNASKALENFEDALAGGVITSEQMAEANRHAEKMADLKAKEYETAMTQINETIRTEANSDDVYVRRMRPTFGYLMAITWGVQMLGLSYIMVFQTEKTPIVLEGMESLSTIWAVALSVLGIYVYKRSEEKKTSVFSVPASKSKAELPPVEVKNNLSKNPTAKPKVNE